jgi:hypothetical protein
VTTIFDPEVDVYLDTVGDAASHADWAAVVLRAGATRRRRSAARVTVAMAVPAVGALGLLASGMVGGPGVTLAERAQAEVLAPPSATDGTVIHDTVRYRDATGTVFMSYDTWVAPDGTWCRRTREGAPGGTASSVGVPTAFTQCRLPNQTVELYIPADNAIYRVHAGAAGTGGAPATQLGTTPSGLLVRLVNPGLASERLDVFRPDRPAKVVVDGNIVRGAHRLTDAEVDALSHADLVAIKQIVANTVPTAASVDPGPAPNWISEELTAALGQQGLREDGTQDYDGRTYVRMVTAGMPDVLLVDPSTKDVAVWIPGPAAFGTSTVVTHVRSEKAADASSLRDVALEQLYPSATVKAVSPSHYSALLSSQYPNG